MRLDRFLTQQTKQSNKQVRQQIDAGEVLVDGDVTIEWNQRITRFSEIVLAGERLQENTAEYWMLHKPIGVVSDTKHPHHKTVLDCLDIPNKALLHVAGRLDLNTSGLVLLTNNGAWSKAITSASSQMPKVYEVTLDQPIPPETEAVFAQGIYFVYEDITTLPAEIERLSDCQARLTLTEGRYHQVKRMFGHLGLRVTALHRSQIGAVKLPSEIAVGQYRKLCDYEVAALAGNANSRSDR
ncbi:MAG: pseudouridine synthase [Gammaproteobacteria bacterium]|nr:pseudouridine synthase [Gammaproteobacteria bacterium]